MTTNQTPEQALDAAVERVMLAAYECYYFRDKDELTAKERREWSKGQLDHGDHAPDECPTIHDAITACGDARYAAGRRDGQRWVLCKPCVDAWTGHEEEIERLTIVCAACGSLREQEGARLMVWERNGEIHEENGNCVRAGCVAAPATPTETKPT